jgi:hypothetical protein
MTDRITSNGFDVSQQGQANEENIFLSNSRIVSVQGIYGQENKKMLVELLNNCMQNRQYTSKKK